MTYLEPRPGNSGCAKPDPKIVAIVARLAWRAMRHPRRAWWALQREMRRPLQQEEIPGGYRTY